MCADEQLWVLTYLCQVHMVSAVQLSSYLGYSLKVFSMGELPMRSVDRWILGPVIWVLSTLAFKFVELHAVLTFLCAHLSALLYIVFQLLFLDISTAFTYL